jgi:hypothetical protein
MRRLAEFGRSALERLPMSPKWASDYSLKGDGPTEPSRHRMHDERCKNN